MTPAMTETAESEIKVYVRLLDGSGEVISVCAVGDCSFLYKKSKILKKMNKIGLTGIIKGIYPRTVCPLDTLHIWGMYKLTSAGQYRYIKLYDRVCKATNLGLIDYKSE